MMLRNSILGSQDSHDESDAQEDVLVDNNVFAGYLFTSSGIFQQNLSHVMNLVSPKQCPQWLKKVGRMFTRCGVSFYWQAAAVWVGGIRNITV